MSKNKSTKDLYEHKEQAVNSVNSYLDSLIQSENAKIRGKADKLSYWFEDYINFLSFEPIAKQVKWHKYKRGQIIKVHLGYNVGSEEGGLHYAVVLNANDNTANSVLNIIPLTSVKPNTDTNKLRNGNVYLGNELFTNLIAKHSTTIKFLSNEKKRIESIMDDIEHGVPIDIDEVTKQLLDVERKLALFERLRKEITKMKIGSIALVNQITTISKIRIYDPKNNNDILYGIKLSNEKLDLIDEEVKKLFTKS